MFPGEQEKSLEGYENLILSSRTIPPPGVVKPSSRTVITPKQK